MANSSCQWSIYTNILEKDISYTTLKPTRVELYNLKGPEGQAKSNVLTLDTVKLTDCFESDYPFEKRAAKS